MVWYTYILTNHTNKVLYVGITNDIRRRVKEYKRRSSEKSFTARYHVYKLVWLQEFDTPLAAIEAEKQIKGWVRAKKIALISKLNPQWKNLAQI